MKLKERFLKVATIGFILFSLNVQGADLCSITLGGLIRTTAVFSRAGWVEIDGIQYRRATPRIEDLALRTHRAWFPNGRLLSVPVEGYLVPIGLESVFLITKFDGATLTTQTEGLVRTEKAVTGAFLSGSPSRPTISVNQRDYPYLPLNNEVGEKFSELLRRGESLVEISGDLVTVGTTTFFVVTNVIQVGISG